MTGRRPVVAARRAGDAGSAGAGDPAAGDPAVGLGPAKWGRSADTDSCAGPPGEVRRWAAAQLGELTEILDVSWPRPDSRVWRAAVPSRATPGTAATVYVKISPSAPAYVREVAAYRHAADALAPGEAPRLLAADPQLRVLVTGEVDGQVASTADVAGEQQAGIHRRAGRLLGRWQAHHRTPLTGAARAEVLTGVQARVRVGAAQVQRTSDLITGAQHEVIAHALHELPVLAERLPLAFRHGDFAPRNWLWNPGTDTVALVDFEHAHTGIAVEDLVWLAATTWPDAPHLRRALFDGLGHDLGVDEAAALPQFVALTALSYLDAGAATSRPELVERARAALNASEQSPGARPRPRTAMTIVKDRTETPTTRSTHE